jgi:hypothetical protein
MNLQMNNKNKKSTHNPTTTMKRLLALVTLGGLFAAATAHAQVDVYITGSTAFRANTYRSVRAIYGANLTGQNPSDPNGSGSNSVTWAGTIPALFGGQTVTIRAAYSGSAAGIQTLTANSSLNFLANSTAGDTTTVSHQADLALSDVFQTTTLYTTPTLVDTNVGVQPFVWVKSLTAPAAITNITIQQLQAFMSGGVIPLSYFTGNTNDTSVAHLVGRDTGSGTRITAEADALIVGTPVEWQPDGSCNWSISTGFSSGSGIAGVLKGSCSASLGYLGVADANGVNSGLNALSYDGVKANIGTVATPDFSPVRRGQYSLWSYEHLFRRSASSANVTAFYLRLAQEINNDLATSTSAIQVGSMVVSRSADGGPIAP